MKLLPTLGIVAGAALLLPTPAFSQVQFNYSGVHKWSDGTKVYVYIPGVTAGQAVTGLTTPKTSSKTLRTDACGWGKISKGTNTITNVTGSATIAFSSKSSGTAPTCTKDSTSGNYVSSPDPSPSTVIETSDAYFVRVGATSGSTGSIPIQITSDSPITTKANQCGFLRLTASTARPLTTFKIGQNTNSLAALPQAPNPMICRKVGNTSIAYIPAP